MRFSPYNVFALMFAAVCALAPVCGAYAREEAAVADDAAMKDELAYITALVEANMPDFAEPVIAAAKKKWPQLGPKLKVLEIQGDLRLGKFADVQKVVDAIKDKKSSEYWALRLSMADAYYARSMMPECRKIYREFFTAVPKPSADLTTFYVESGFKWAQICVNEKSYDEAVKMFGGLLALEKQLDEEVWCLLASEDVDLLIRLATETTDKKLAKKRADYLTQATSLADKLLWKQELPIYFGKGIAAKAHIEMLRDNPEQTEKLIMNYMKDLSMIHNALKEQDPDGRLGYVRMSPMPECRYLLAELMWDRARKEAAEKKPNEDKIKDSLLGARVGNKRNGQGAFIHAINVFINYPESKWAVDAGQLVDEINAFVLQRYKKDLKQSAKVSPEQMKRVRQMQFKNAYDLYKGSDFAKAVQAYGDILTRFPETDESPGATAFMAESLLNLWSNEKKPAEKTQLRLETDAVEGYLAERFAGLKPDLVRMAGDEVLRLAAKERDFGALGRSQQLYTMYFNNFPTHYNAAQTALTLAGRAYTAEDWDAAIRYHSLVATVYTNSPHYANSLRYLAICNAKVGNTDEQAVWLRKFAAVAKRPIDRTSSLLRLALMQQKQGFADFAAAAETNEAERATLQRSATINVIKAIKDFKAVAAAATAALDDKTTDKANQEQFLLQREQALFLEGDSWQRLQMPVGKMTVESFRANAVKAYEQYLALYPKGRYAPQILVKIGTIHTADKNMEASQKAFARLQQDFPDSDEAKNSVPRLARTLIEMGLRAEGVAQYKQMLETTGGKYTAGQFIAAGDALLDAKSWDVAQEAYAKALDLSKGAQNAASTQAFALLGEAKALYGAGSFGEARQKLDDFIEKFPKSQLVVDAYEMLIVVAAEEGRKEKDDTLRLKCFNAAVGAIKKVRGYKKSQADVDLLDLRSGDVLVDKMEAEEAMNLREQARETCGRAVVTFQAFLMAHEPTEEHPAKDMTPAQLANLERCYSTVLPLMAKLGKEQSELILKYGETYLELFPDGKHKTVVQNAMNQARVDR